MTFNKYIKLLALAIVFAGFAQTTQAQTKAPAAVNADETAILSIPADVQLLTKEELAEMDPAMSYEEYLRAERQPVRKTADQRTLELNALSAEQKASVKKAVPTKSQDDDGEQQ